MNGKELLAGMGYVDDRFIEEAEKTQHFHSAHSGYWRRIGAAAACACLILVGAWQIRRGNSDKQMGFDALNAQETITEKSSEKHEESAMMQAVWNGEAAQGLPALEDSYSMDSMRESCRNAEVFALFGGKFLPDEILDGKKLAETEHSVLTDNGEKTADALLVQFSYGKELLVLAQLTDEEILTGDGVTEVSGQAVRFTEIVNAGEVQQRRAELVVRLPEAQSGIYLVLSSMTLERTDMEQAAAEILKFVQEDAT